MKYQFLLFSFLLLFITNNLFAAKYTVFVSANKFDSPSQGNQLTINQGDTVDWFFLDRGFSTTSGVGCVADGEWDSGNMDSGTTFTRKFDSAGTFSYFSTAQCAGGMVGQVTVRRTSGIYDAPAQNLIGSATAFPNPCNLKSTLEYELKQPARVNVQLIDLSGKVLSELIPPANKGINRTEVNMESLPDGMYFARILVNGIPAENKVLIKQR